MDRKLKVLALILLVVVASVAGSLMLAMQSTAKADTNSTVASDVQPTLSSVNGTDNGGFINGDRGFGGQRIGDFGGHRGMGGFGEFGGNLSSAMMPGGFSSIQVSSDFTQNVTNIAKNDSDVQNLLTQGYNITSIRPVISTVIDGNGNVVTQATSANVILQSTTGRALVVVDLTQEKVTKIITTTTTVINK